MIKQWQVLMQGQDLLGTGGSGSVVAGEYETDRVAIKVIKTMTPEGSKAAEKEITFALSHPNIVKVLGYYEVFAAMDPTR